MDKLRVVIADDEALIRLDLKEILIEAGHIVVAEASDGEEAVRLVRELKPDMVIMDVKMPGGDGISAAEVLTREQLAPVVLLTAYSQDDVVGRANQAGVMAYLVKPVREEQLFPAMQIALTRFAEIRGSAQKAEELRREMEKLLQERDEYAEKLGSMKVLARAKGILMDAHGLTEDEAYRRMQQYSMNRRIPIKQLAEAIIAAAEKKKHK